MTIGAVLATLGLLWVLQKLGDLLIALLLALFLSFALEPAVQFLSKRRRWKRSSATALVFVVAGLVGLGFLAAVLTPLLTQTGSFFSNLPDWLDQVSEWLDEWFGIELSLDAALEDFDSLGSLIQGYADDVGRGVIGFGSTVAGAVLGLLTMGLFTFYLLADGPRLRRSVLSAVRPEVQAEVLRLWEVAIQKTGGYVYSRLLLAVASAVFTYLVLLIIGVPFAIPLALWVGVVSQAIPAFGTYLAAIAPILVALFTDPIKAVWVLVALVVYQQIENFVLQPRITARTMALHPAIAFGAVLAGAALLGAIGALIALPTAAIVQAFISTYLEHHEVIENVLAED
ncbi:MAG: AI-2E family transporter [Acidimicrobiia bacterium]|nr:AI-2E family transporter [Acidimicrobiia bacterium]